MGDLTKNFDRIEMACQCGCGQDVLDYKTAVCNQRLRGIVGRPMTPNSANRCKKHNKRVGGSKNSYHPKHMALHYQTPLGMTVEEFAENGLIAGFTGIGLYDWGCHFDTGPARSWDRRTVK